MRSKINAQLKNRQRVEYRLTIERGIAELCRHLSTKIPGNIRKNTGSLAWYAKRAIIEKLERDGKKKIVSAILGIDNVV